IQQQHHHQQQQQGFIHGLPQGPMHQQPSVSSCAVSSSATAAVVAPQPIHLQYPIHMNFPQAQF
ncbi:hypothetical protein BGZ89_009232, partial [Linnemannia elongata]